MSAYRDRIYPVLVDRLGNPKPIQALRQRSVSLARGIVLEIGAGSGANFPYYDQVKVEHLYALEPNPGMRRLAEHRRRADLEIEFLSLPGERIPLENESVDSVVTTFTLCTVPAPERVLEGITRVLKPGSVLIFLENSLASNRRVARWQRWWEPVHSRLFEGLRLTRDVPATITRAGFRLERVECLYVSPFPKSWSHCCWGTAVKR